MHYCGIICASVWKSHRLLCIIVELSMHQCGKAIVCYALLWNYLCISVEKPSSVMHYCGIIYASVWKSHRLLCIIVKLSIGELQTVAIVCINTVLFITCQGCYI